MSPWVHPGDPICRGCRGPLSPDDVFCDLGAQPLANALLTHDQLVLAEVHYPLRPLVCRSCLLVQLPNVPDPSDLFPGGYPFFSGQSATWFAHCKTFADAIVKMASLGSTSRVIEIGSNDGTMLRRFRGLGIPALGVEPCARVAEHALMEGLATIQGFWSESFARELAAGHTGEASGVTKSGKANLVIANNVLAHVPDLLDFLRGVRAILAPGGIASFEVPHILNLIQDGAYDQVYAEHHCYFSLHSLRRALELAGLRACGVEVIPTHGGSLRVYADVGPHDTIDIDQVVVLEAEKAAALDCVEGYLAFAAVPPRIKRDARFVLTEHTGHKIVGYGASAKAAVTLNYLGIGPEWIEFVADTTPAKWGHYIPGARIPIVSPRQLEEAQPDVVVNFAWNWREESEANIRRACPNATILYLRDEIPATQEAS